MSRERHLLRHAERRRTEQVHPHHTPPLPSRVAAELLETTVNLRRAIAIIVAGALALTAASTVSAGAATTGSTTLTVTLTGGSLAIAAPSTASASAAVTPGTALTITLSDSTVTDNRGTLAGWTVTGSATDLTHTVTNTYTIPTTGLVWATGTVATSNGSLSSVAAGAGGSMATTFAVAAALNLFGAGSFTYPATITGVVPVNLITGDYTGTVTQSVA